MSDSVMIQLKPAQAKRLGDIRRRYSFTREEMIRLMISNYPVATERQGDQPADPIERHAVAQIGMMLEDLQHQLSRAQTVAAEWNNTIQSRKDAQQ